MTAPDIEAIKARDAVELVARTAIAKHEAYKTGASKNIEPAVEAYEAAKSALLAAIERLTVERDEQFELAFTTMPDGASVLWSEMHQAASARAKSAAARTTAAETALAETKAENERLREGLEFYADPDTYCAIGFFPDPHCGLFMEDFSDDHGGDYDRIMPGKFARDLLKKGQNNAG